MGLLTQLFHCPSGTHLAARAAMDDTTDGGTHSTTSFDLHGSATPMAFPQLGPAAHTARQKHHLLDLSGLGVDELDVLGTLLGVEAPRWEQAIDFTEHGGFFLPYDASFTSAVAEAELDKVLPAFLQTLCIEEPRIPPGLDLSVLPPEIAANFGPDRGWRKALGDLQDLARAAIEAGDVVVQFTTP